MILKLLKRFFVFLFWLLVVTILLFFWVRFVEPGLLEVEEVYVSLNMFPGEMKVMHLTDLHSFSYGDKERRVVEEAIELDPDFIVITGDIVDWKTEELEDIFNFWQDLSGVTKTYAVWGNHDHRNPTFKDVRSFMASSNIEMLVNESRSINWSSGTVSLIGVDDPHLGYDDIEKAMEDVIDRKPRILLAHSPEVVRKVEDVELDLILTGHTHGCQMNIPIVCNWIIPLKYDKHFKSGLFELEDRYLYVNRGVGESFLPIRFNSRPEITLITIQPE